MARRKLIVDLSDAENSLSRKLEEMCKEVDGGGCDTVVFKVAPSGKLNYIPDAFIAALQSKGFRKLWNIFGAAETWTMH